MSWIRRRHEDESDHPRSERSDDELPHVADDARHGELYTKKDADAGRVPPEGVDPDPPEAKPQSMAQVSAATMSEVSALIHKLEDCQVVRPAEPKRTVRFQEAMPTCFGPPSLSILTPKKNPGGDLNVVATPEWTEIEITVDSGACDTVMPTDMCSHISILQNAKSRVGYEYEVANGEGLLNRGERQCLMMTQDSSSMKRIAFQCADVHKALLSVSKLADHGYECLLGKHGGELRDVVTGDVIPLIRRDNLYVMKAWIKQDEAGFSRRE